MISGFSGILCSYLVPFFALSKPAPLSCSVLRFLIVIISRRYILSSPMSMPLSQRHHCHCHGSHHEQYHRFHRHCHHQGRSGPLPLCLLLCNFHQNKQNIKVCCLRTDENHWKQKFSVSYNLLNQFEDLTSANVLLCFLFNIQQAAKMQWMSFSGRFVIFPFHDFCFA